MDRYVIPVIQPSVSPCVVGDTGHMGERGETVGGTTWRTTGVNKLFNTVPLPSSLG